MYPKFRLGKISEIKDYLIEKIRERKLISKKALSCL